MKNLRKMGIRPALRSADCRAGQGLELSGLVGEAAEDGAVWSCLAFGPSVHRCNCCKCLLACVSL